MTVYKKLCAIISAQQKGHENTAAYYVGEQLKDIARNDPHVTEMLIQDLQQPQMTIFKAEAQIRFYADSMHKGSKGNVVCVTPDKAETILRNFYGLPKRNESQGQAPAAAPAADGYIDLDKLLFGD